MSETEHAEPKLTAEQRTAIETGIWHIREVVPCERCRAFAASSAVALAELDHLRAENARLIEECDQGRDVARDQGIAIERLKSKLNSITVPVSMPYIPAEATFGMGIEGGGRQTPMPGKVVQSGYADLRKRLSAEAIWQKAAGDFFECDLLREARNAIEACQEQQRADAAEIERLKAENNTAWSNSDCLKREGQELRAELAELKSRPIVLDTRELSDEECEAIDRAIMDSCQIKGPCAITMCYEIRNASLRKLLCHSPDRLDELKAWIIHERDSLLTLRDESATQSTQRAGARYAYQGVLSKIHALLPRHRTASGMETLRHDAEIQQ